MPPTSTPTLTPELKTLFEELRTGIAAAAPAQKLAELQRQVDALDLASQGRHFVGGDFTEDTLTKALDESTELKRMREVGKGKAVISLGDLNQIPMQRKTLTGTSMTGTAGVIMPERVGPIVNLAQRRLFLRDLLYRGNKTTTNQVYFVKELTFVNGASPTAEVWCSPFSIQSVLDACSIVPQLSNESLFSSPDQNRNLRANCT
jgi:hypothetical protein